VNVGTERLIAEEPHRLGLESRRPGDPVYLGIDPAQARLINSEQEEEP
jgi:hypothetical protein